MESTEDWGFPWPGDDGHGKDPSVDVGMDLAAKCTSMDINDLTGEVIGAAIEVHKAPRTWVVGVCL